MEENRNGNISEKGKPHVSLHWILLKELSHVWELHECISMIKLKE